MDANEVHELQEHQEHGSHEAALRPIGFTMSMLAVLLAVTTMLGERTHTEAVLNQNKATDEWNFYQAHKIRSNDTELMTDLLGVVAVNNKDAGSKLAKTYADHQKKWADELKDEQAQAQALEDEVKLAEARVDRYDLAEVLLEIGLVITSVTLLTHSRLYWYFGMMFALGGVVSALSVLFLK